MVYSVCSLIFGLLVNAIVTKTVSAASSSDLESGAVSLMTGSLEGEEEPDSPSLPHPNAPLSVNEIDIEEAEEILRQPK